jgi:hypothetical protein
MGHFTLFYLPSFIFTYVYLVSLEKKWGHGAACRLSSGAGEQILTRQMFRLGQLLHLPEAWLGAGLKIY